MRHCLLGTVVVSAVLSSGCVTRGTHRAALAELSETQARLTSAEQGAQQERRRLQAEIADLRLRQETLRDSLAARERELSRLSRTASSTESERLRLQERLQDRGQEVEGLQRRLDALAAVEAEVRERNRIYEEILARFRSLIDGGQLSVRIDRGRLVILLPQDVLFTSGSASLNREGTATVIPVGQALAALPDRRFQVEGHTDDVPISTARFPSNWELSAARALTVVRLLTEQGVAPAHLSAAGFGEHQPVASNETADGRRANRRIEIVMLPDLDLVSELSPSR
ncbi:MAG: OmpA family protein [Gemmatimonadota bacterium]